MSHRHELRCAEPGDRGGRRRPSRPPRPPTSTPPSPGPPRPSAAGPPLAPADRARLLRRFAAVVDEHIEELARLEVREAGHTIGNARWEAGNVRDLLDYAAGGVERLTGRQIPVAGGLDVTFLEPLGVVGVIAPWNFPMPIAAWGTAPALAAGNAVILKPAETTPLTALRLAELALEAGLPEHLFQVLPGRGRRRRATRWSSTPASRRSSSPAPPGVGKQIMATCADRVKRVTLELGGKSPNIVFADADLEAAAAAAPMSFLDNTGQDCCARTRILVQRSRLRPVPRAARARRSSPSSSATRPTRRPQMGPLISPAQLDRVRSYVPDDAPGHPRQRPRGPRLLVPADRPHRRRARRPRRRRGDLRPGRRRPALRRRGGRRSGWPTPPTTASPAPSGPATSAARCASRGAVAAGNLSVNSHCQRPLLDPVRRLQAVRPRPRARPRRPHRFHRDQERLHQHGGLNAHDRDRRHHLPPPGRPHRRHHRRRQRHRPGHRPPPRLRGRPRRLRRHRRDRRQGRRRRGRRHSSSRSTSPTPSRSRRCSRPPSTPTAASTSPSTTPGISPPDDDSILDHRPGRLEARPGGQPHLRLPVLQGRHPLHAAPGQGLDHQHRVVRGA